MTFNLTVKNNATAQRFEAQVGDHLAVIQYQRQGNRITFIHTHVPHALEGQGVGSRLAQFALEYA
jgi:predicted GNAT family acetyltransferase